MRFVDVVTASIFLFVYRPVSCTLLWGASFDGRLPFLISRF